MQKTSETTYQELRLILGDQLNAAHSWFQEKRSDVVYLIAELPQEVGYVRHHIQKVLAFFAGMEQFANALEKSGHPVIYLTLDDTTKYQNLPDLLNQLTAQFSIQQVSYQRPDEYRLLQQLQQWSETVSVPVSCVDTEHFLLPFDEIQDYFGEKIPVMEMFYRRMRQRFNILLDEQKKPVGGQWNYDAENRQKLPDPRCELEPLLFQNDVSHLLARLQRHQVQTMGHFDGSDLLWPTTRRQSRELLQFFLQFALPNFGKYQDAMTPKAWSLYHSRVSFSLNCKMLHPREVILGAIAAWHARPEEISLAQVEGFVRQILGWREYVRGVYWAMMPEFAEMNHLNHSRSLPSYFWTGKTKMACMQHAITQSLDYAYAHHIQRLMVIGNFGLLAGIDPKAMDDWYLGVYIDAIEWVELPNTRGMSQFADGGTVGTKPYISSGQYIHKMSHYCSSCFYNVKHKTEADACPFNALYWHFLMRNQQTLRKNHRLKMPYASWQKMSEEQQQQILRKGETLLQQIEIL